jgi:O-antigen/teichoic acid export membrane protein
MALYRADVLLIQHLSGTTQAGLYAVAAQWSELVWFVPIAVQSILLQSTAQLWLDHRRIGEITNLLSRLLRYVALGTAFLLTYIFVFAGQLLYLFFGPDFVAATPALRLLIPGVFSFSLARLMWPVIQARGYVLALILISAIATLANLGLNWFLMPAWGAIGAALASCLTYGTVIFAYTWILHKWGVQPLRGLKGGRLLLLCTVMMLILMPIALLVTSALLAIIIGGLLGGVVYGLGALWLGLIMVAELRQIIDSLPDFLGRPGAKILDLLQPLLLRVEVSGQAEP